MKTEKKRRRRKMKKNLLLPMRARIPKVHLRSPHRSWTGRRHVRPYTAGVSSMGTGKPVPKGKTPPGGDIPEVTSIIVSASVMWVPSPSDYLTALIAGRGLL